MIICVPKGSPFVTLDVLFSSFLSLLNFFLKKHRLTVWLFKEKKKIATEMLVCLFGGDGVRVIGMGRGSKMTEMRRSCCYLRLVFFLLFWLKQWLFNSSSCTAHTHKYVCTYGFLVWFWCVVYLYKPKIVARSPCQMKSSKPYSVNCDARDNKKTTATTNNGHKNSNLTRD